MRRVASRQTTLDCRSATSVLNYALMLAIVTLLIAGLLTGVGDLVESQQERAILTQMDTVGNSLAADIETTSRLVNRTGGDSVHLRTHIPDTVGSSHYTATIVENDGEQYIALRSSDPSVRTRVEVRSAVGLENTVVDGGGLRIRYDSGDDELVVTDD